MRTTRPVAVALVVLLSVAGCGASDRLDPDPPQAIDDDPLAMLARPVSVINVPMQIPVARLLELVEDAVPVRFGDLEELRPRSDSSNVRLAYELERDPFGATFTDAGARLSASVSYRLRVRYPLPALPDVESSCGMGDDPRPRLVIGLESPMSVRSDWSLGTAVRIRELRPASPEDADRCTVTFLGIDITDDVVEGARDHLSEHLEEIDSLIAGVDTRSRFESWWSTLGEPVQLGDSVWLAMNPQGIRRGPIHGSGDTITVELALLSHPEIVVGRRPPGPATSLPALDSGSVVPRLELLVDGRAHYSAASQLLTELLGARPLDMDGRVVSIDAVRIFGIGGGRLAMEVGVSGDLTGRLFLTGRPAVDRETGLVSIPDLELDVATRSVVISSAAWFATRAFREYLRERATWPTDPAVEWLSDWLVQGLNRDLSDDLSVSGSVDRVEIVGITAFREALVVRMRALGSASLNVRR